MKPRVERWGMFGGDSEEQKVQPLGVLRQCHVDDVTPLVFSLDKSSLKTGGLVYRPGNRK